MKRWMSKHPRIVVDKNFSFNIGPETVLLNYKASDGDALHSIEIRIGDLDAFKKAIIAMEREIENPASERKQTRTVSSQITKSLE